MLPFCLYRPVSLYIWFVAGCMFKLYHCCSLYSLLIFLFVYTGWNGTKPVCFSEEIFSKLHRSCLAVLKAEPWTVCTMCWILLWPELACCTEGPQSLCCWGSPALGWALGKPLCSAPTAREIRGSVSKITCFSWIHHFFHLLKGLNLLR